MNLHRASLFFLPEENFSFGMLLQALVKYQSTCTANKNKVAVFRDNLPELPSKLPLRRYDRFLPSHNQDPTALQDSPSHL